MRFILTLVLLCAAAASAQNTNALRRPRPVKELDDVSVLAVEKMSRDSRNAAALDALVRQYHSTKPHHYRFGNWARIELKNKDVKAFEARGKREQTLKRVLFAQECQAIAFPADPLLSQQWGLLKVQATNAWATSAGSSNVIVGVVDTGILYAHPDLAGQFYFDSIDQANGYTANNGVLTVGGNDDHGHGTHCAGIIAAKAGNGLGISGVAPGVRLMAFKFLKANGSGWDTDFALLADKIIELKTRGVNLAVLNHSWGGGGGSEFLLATFQALEDHGVLSVCAAGNSGVSLDVEKAAPAGLPVASIIAVAASDPADQPAVFSNYGLAVEVAAPGVSILSTVPFFGTSISDSNGYAFLSGTSMACPQVAGLAALVRSIRPEFNPVQVRSVICNRNSYDAVSPRYTATGRINCFKTVQRAVTATGAVNQPPAIMQWTPDTVLRAGGTLPYHFTATDPEGDPLEYQIVSPLGAGPTNQTVFTIPEYVRPAYYFAQAAVVDGNGGYDWKLTHIDALTNGSVYPAFNVMNATVTKSGNWYAVNACVDDGHVWIYDATTWLVDGNPYINRSSLTATSCNPVGFALQYQPEHLVELKALNDLGQWAGSTNRFYFNGAGAVAVPTNHFPKLVMQTDVDWGVAPLTVHWNIAASYDVDDGIELYWHQEDNGSFIYLTPGPTAGEFTFTAPGRQYLEFMVRDNRKGMHYDYKEINVLHAGVAAPGNLRIAP